MEECNDILLSLYSWLTTGKKLFNITPFILDHLQSSEMQESDNKTPLVLKAQITSNCLLHCQMHYRIHFAQARRGRSNAILGMSQTRWLMALCSWLAIGQVHYCSSGETIVYPLCYYLTIFC
jgi:hypothetical protein